MKVTLFSDHYRSAMDLMQGALELLAQGQQVLQADYYNCAKQHYA